MAAKRSAIADTPAGKIADLTSDAYLDLAPETLEPLLDGVEWRQAKAWAPGALVPNAVFLGRGKRHAPLAHRLLETVCRAPSSPRADALRRSIKSLSLESTAPLDLSPLAGLPALEWVVVKAPALRSLPSIAHVKKIELAVEDLDLAPLAGASVDELLLDFTKRPCRSLSGTEVLAVGALRILHAAPTAAIGARKLDLMPSSPAIGPLTGSMSALSIYNDDSLRSIVLGDLPRLQALRVRLSALTELVGAERCGALQDVTLWGTSLQRPPALPPTVVSLDLEGADLDLSDLAGMSLPHLRTLRVAARGAVRRLDAIAGHTGLRSLSLEPGSDLRGLDTVLPRLPDLEYLSLAGHVVERVPSVLKACPRLEVVSLVGCSGFLEHDVLADLPALRSLLLAGSTLASFKKQIDPRLRQRGVTLDFERRT